jgi:hypothetical protein
MNITFPWYNYPFLPLSGYNDTDTYKPELLKLYEFINSYDINDEKILLHLTIGSAMEEYNNTCKPFQSNFESQWKQLFPDHIFEYVVNGGTCLLFIISPDESFSQKKFIEPVFLQKTNHIFKWNNIGNYYYSDLYNIKIYIFNTMMPTNNKKYIYISPEIFSEELSRKYTTTKEDILFVNLFYKSIELFFHKILSNMGNITCFSFAVFHKSTDYSHLICNYAMFSEILEIGKKYNKIVFAEWRYVPEKYVLIFVGNNMGFITYNHTKLDQELGVNWFNFKLKIIKIIDDKLLFIPLNQ